MNVFNGDCHTKKSVNETLNAFKFETKWSHYTRVAQVIILHHCEGMRLIFECNNYIDAKVTLQTIDEEVVDERGGEEEEQWSLVVFRPATKENPESHLRMHRWRKFRRRRRLNRQRVWLQPPLPRTCHKKITKLCLTLRNGIYDFMVVYNFTVG